MIEKIRIRDFRNFENIELKFNSNLNIFIGKNGQGKTNLLESIYFCLNGRSFRFSNNETLLKQKSERAFLNCLVKVNENDFNISIGLEKRSKSVSINSKKISFTEISTRLPTVLFSPESLSVIKDSSDQRRNLIDDFIASDSISNAKILNAYRKSLRSRNRILKDIKTEIVNLSTGENLLNALDEIYLSQATEVTFLRIQYLHKIKDDLNNAMQNISKNQNVDISVEYVASSTNIGNYTHQKIRDLLLNRSTELKKVELSAGTSLIGPHKHDITFLYNGNDSRIFCSQGQQRAMILSFKMAQIVYHRRAHGTYPVLMLDDVFSELDAEKRLALISFLNEINAQIFITTTDLDLPKNLGEREFSVYAVNEGVVRDDRVNEELWSRFDSSP